MMTYHQMMKEQLGGDAKPTDPRLAVSYMDLAVKRGFKREYAECAADSKKAIELCQWLTKPGDSLNITSLSSANMSLSLLELGDVEAAKDVALQALSAREAILGIDDRVSFM